MEKIHPTRILVYTKRGFIPYIKKRPNYLRGDENPMTNIHDIVLQIKDKNVIWEDKTEEVYFKKEKKACFSTLLIRIVLMLVLTVAV